MGRGRLRRGCSLEVIFEEDPDFCSHLDSLDGGVAIRFGIKEPDDTISLDSLLEIEEYQVRFQDPADAEQVFRSLDGFIDVRNMDSCMVEWDEFSMDSNSSKTEEESGIVTTDRNAFLENNDLAITNNAEKTPSGRRSRVSRRQIIQATWLGYSSSSDESVTNNDLDDNDKSIGTPSSTNAAPAKPPRRRSPSSRHNKSKQLGKTVEQTNDDMNEPCSSMSLSPTLSSANIQVTSPDGIDINNNCATANSVTSVEDFLETNDCKEDAIGLQVPIQVHLRSSPNSSAEGAQYGASALLSPSSYAMFGRSDAFDIMEKDTLDSYISTMTDETDTNAYTFADPFDDTHSVASTNYESSGSTSSTESNGSVCTVNSFLMQKGKPKLNDNNGGENTNNNTSSGSVSPTITTEGDVESGNRSSKYRSNLKVELVSQLNKSHEENLHSSTAALASGSTTVNPSSNLYSRDSYLNLQSPCSTLTSIANMAVEDNNVASPSHQRQQHQRVLLNHQQSLTDNERQACTGEVKRVRALFELRNHSRTSLNGSERSGNSSNGSTCPSSPESVSRSISSRNAGDISPSESHSGRVGLYSKNGRRSRASPSKLLRSTYTTTNSSPTRNNGGGSNSNLHLGGSSSPVGGNNQSSYDYVDLLVNDNVVIEDSPDLYQAVRSRRQTNFDRDSIPSPPTSNKRPVTLLNLGSQDGIPGGGSLRRSQSMGTGISAIGGPSSTTSCVASGILRQSASKTNILAEELPAPDTVKNVRNVFENMLKMKSNNHGSTNSVDMSPTTPTGFSGSFSIVKKSLSYIKSNPTSKIYRSESMRDDFPSMGRRFGKPVLMSETNSPVRSPSYSSFVAPSSSGSTRERTTTSTAPTIDSISDSIKFRCSAANTSGGDVVDGTNRSGRGVARRSSSVSPMNKNPIERKISEPAKFSPKINTGLSPSSVPIMLRTSCQVPLTEEDPSFSSNVSSNAAEDYRSRKYVHPDVLSKIRSAGTTITYFGGQIVAKTIKNRKIPVSRRHTFDFHDYVGISGDGASFTNNYDSYSSSNYYKEDETGENKCRSSTSGSSSGCGGAASGGGKYGRSGSSRPALDIPLKSSASSSIYASQNTTISATLDSIFASGLGGILTFASKPIDTTPRIISVLHKSPTGSPIKSCSPVSSVIEEGRNSPEGCEATNEKTVVEQDGNNNNLPGKVDSSSRGNCTGESDGFNKKFSQITEGAWF